MLVLGIRDKEQIRLGNQIVLRFRRSDEGGGWKILIEAPIQTEIQRESDDLLESRNTNQKSNHN